MGPRVVTVILFLAFISFSTPAAAITIVGNFLPFSSGPDNDPASGGGNIEAVFEAAAHEWELAILDDATVAIDFYWDAIPDALAFSFGDTLTGSIAVTTMADWFVDPTPETGDEYLTEELSLATLGATTLTYGVGLSDGIGTADGHDLFTVILHEIGHVLSAGPNIGTECGDGDVDVAPPLPYAGVAIPTFNCFHVGLPSGYTGFNPLMFPFNSPGERSFISDADLLYVAQNGGWENVRTSGVTAVPEPASLMLLGVGLGLVRRMRRL